MVVFVVSEILVEVNLSRSVSMSLFTISPALPVFRDKAVTQTVTDGL